MLDGENGNLVSKYICLLVFHVELSVFVLVSTSWSSVNVSTLYESSCLCFPLLRLYFFIAAHIAQVTQPDLFKWDR